MSVKNKGGRPKDVPVAIEDTAPVDKSNAIKLGKKERFLISYRKWGTQSRALEDSDITLPTLKKWITEDGAFAESFDDIQAEIDLTRKDDLEEAALARAMSRSDVLLKFLLSKIDPSYRERSEIEHKGGINVVFKENINLDDL